MGDPVTGMLVVSAISEGGGIISKIGSANKQQQAVRNQITQQRLAETQRSIDREKDLQKTIASQQVQAAARGISPSSGSFKNLTQQSFNQFNEDEKADALNLQIRETSLQEQSDEISQKEFGDIFGSLANYSMSMYKQTGF